MEVDTSEPLIKTFFTNNDSSTRDIIFLEPNNHVHTYIAGGTF